MINAGTITWKDARPMVHSYFNFWPDGEDRLWCKQLWPYIEKAGLTVYHTEAEEMRCSAIPGCLALMYQELITRLGVDCRVELTENNYRELFNDGAEYIESILNKVREVLLRSIGMQELLELTVRSIVTGVSQPVDSDSLKTKISELTTFPLRDIMVEKVYYFFEAGSLHPIDFESVTFQIEEKQYETS